MIKIEKGIPIPKKERKSKYPLAEMQIGDSFLIDLDGKKSEGTKTYICTSSTKLGIKTIVREIPEGLRVWRVA